MSDCHRSSRFSCFPQPADLKVNLIRHPAAKCLVRARDVIEAEVGSQPGSRLGRLAVGLQVHLPSDLAGSSASVCSPRHAASFTRALHWAKWFHLDRLIVISKGGDPPKRPMTFITHRPVQESETRPLYNYFAKYELSTGSRPLEENKTSELDKSQLIRQRIFSSRQSIGAKYQSLVTGHGGLWSLLRYELTTALLGCIPGAIGLAIRRFAYRGLFKSCGRSLVLGRGVTIRHADKISLGRNVVIDDFCVLDGRGSGEGGLVIGDEVIINRGCIVQSKFGSIRIGSGTNIGAGSHVCSMGGIEIGQSVLVTGGCTISGGQYHTEDLESPIMLQGAYTSGPISIGDGSWLGMKVLVLDGVTVGRGCAIGAGAVVNQSLPDYAVATGVPARVTRIREVAAQQSGLANRVPV